MALRPERAWFDKVYAEHRDRVFRVALRFSGGNRAWANDRTQEAFVKLIEHADRIQNLDDPGGWLYRVAVNACYLKLRREGVWKRIAPSLKRGASAEGELDLALDDKQAFERVRAGLEQLPAKERAVIVMVYMEQKSQKEVAEILNLSKGQISKLHARALEKLKPAAAGGLSE